MTQIFWNFSQNWKGAWDHVGDFWKPSKPDTRDRTKFHRGKKIFGGNSQRGRKGWGCGLRIRPRSPQIGLWVLSILNQFVIRELGIWCTRYRKYKVCHWNSYFPKKRKIASEFEAECIYWGFQSASGLPRNEGREFRIALSPAQEFQNQMNFVLNVVKKNVKRKKEFAKAHSFSLQLEVGAR